MHTSLHGFLVVVYPYGSAVRTERRVLAINLDRAKQLVPCLPQDRITVRPLGSLGEGWLQMTTGGDPSAKDVRDLYRELAHTTKTRSNILDSFALVVPSIRNARLANAILDVIDTGKNQLKGTDKALDKLSGVLAIEHIERLRLGALTGDINPIIKSLAEQSERRLRFRDQLINTVVPPVLNIVAAIAAAIFLAIYQLPVYQNLFATGKEPLPWSTQFLLDIVGAMKAYPILAVAALLSPAFVVWVVPRLYRSIRWVQDLIDDIPVIGDLLEYCRWRDILTQYGNLLASRVSYSRGIELAARSVCHHRTKTFLLSVGSTMSAKACDLFIAGRLHLHVLKRPNQEWLNRLPMGLTSGVVEDVLLEQAADYSEAVEKVMNVLPRVLAFISLIIAAIIIGFVGIATTLPQFRMITLYAK